MSRLCIDRGKAYRNFFDSRDDGAVGFNSLFGNVAPGNVHEFGA